VLFFTNTTGSIPRVRGQSFANLDDQTMDPKSTRKLGPSPLNVTILGLGGVPLGDNYAPLPDAQADATIAAAYNSGIRYFDTAPLYGQGQSEHRFGRILRQLPKQDFVLSTKVGRYLVPEAAEKVDHRWFKGGLNFRPVDNYSYDGVMRSIDQSFQRLGLNRIDILLIHDVDVWTFGEAYEQRFHEAMAGAYRAIDSLRAQGIIKAIGVGVNEIEPCIHFAQAGDFDCLMLAGRYTLLEQGALDKLLPLVEQKGMGILVAGPYNSGILATGAVPGAKYNYREAPPEIMKKVARIEVVCRRYDVPLAACALQFPFGHASISAMVPGAVAPEEIHRNVVLMSTKIPTDLWSELKHEGLLRSDAPVPD
jgi:D-threo-aldose 1-dehydrogenase